MATIRELTRDDAAGIARVHVRAWQAAYAGLVDQAVLDGLTVEARTAEWRDVWLATPNEGTRLVAEVDGETVGFVVGALESAYTSGCGEIYSIYLDPDHWRGGIGTALFTRAIAELRADAPIPLVLWVLEGNDPAIAFYERHGWRGDGGRKDEPLGASVAPHLRYRLD
ncbi:MAG: GNAT family N-acetyltransferase [Actinomycetota bacterium]